MSGVCLYRHDVALSQFQAVHIVVVSLARVLELNLHKVCALVVAGHISQPVVGVELLVLSSAALVTEAAFAAPCYLEFHVFEICHDVYMVLCDPWSQVMNGRYMMCGVAVVAHSECYGFFISATIIFSAMSYITILLFVFWLMSRRARANMSFISITFASLMNGANLFAKFCSSVVM